MVLLGQLRLSFLSTNQSGKPIPRDSSGHSYKSTSLSLGQEPTHTPMPMSLPSTAPAGPQSQNQPTHSRRVSDVEEVVVPGSEKDSTHSNSPVDSDSSQDVEFKEGGYGWWVNALCASAAFPGFQRLDRTAARINCGRLFPSSCPSYLVSLAVFGCCPQKCGRGTQTVHRKKPLPGERDVPVQLLI